MAKPTKPPKNSDESPWDAIFTASGKVIRAEIEAIAGGEVVKGSQSPADRVAQLAKNAALIAAEQRKARAAAIANTKHLTAAQVELWIEQQSPEYRADLARTILEKDSGARKNVF